MLLTYPAIFYKNRENQGYTVVFPDFNNGATCGDNINDSLYMAQDYIGTYLYEYYINKLSYPKASDIEDLEIEQDEYSDLKKSFKTVIGVDIDKYVLENSKQTIKKTLTIPKYLNELGKKEGVNFSKLLTKALKKELNIDC